MSINYLPSADAVSYFFSCTRCEGRTEINKKHPEIAVAIVQVRAEWKAEVMASCRQTGMGPMLGAGMFSGERDPASQNTGQWWRQEWHGGSHWGSLQQHVLGYSLGCYRVDTPVAVIQNRTGVNINVHLGIQFSLKNKHIPVQCPGTGAVIKSLLPLAVLTVGSTRLMMGVCLYSRNRDTWSDCPKRGGMLVYRPHVCTNMI